MTILSASFTVFVLFLMVAAWFGLVRRSRLATSAENRTTLRMASAMAVCSGLMSLLLVIGCPGVVAVILVVSVVIGATPLYRTIVRKMEGIN
jgi:carbon starvation protein CstA